MKKINEAYDILSNETKRKEYDNFLNHQKYHEQKDYSESKQEYQENNINILLQRGFMALEDGEWYRADSFFEQCLNQDIELAEAHLGKLMIDFHITQKADLAKSDRPIESNNHYQRAYHFGNPDLVKFLEQCNKQIEITQKNNIYEEALSLSKSNRIVVLERAIVMFKAIKGWKDSEKQIFLCETKLIKLIKHQKRNDKILFFTSVIAISLIIFTIIYGAVLIR